MLYNHYNLCPCAKPAHVGKCWPGPQSSSSPKQWKSDGHVYNSCQREIATDKIQEEENYREHSSIKNACVSALTGSVPRKMAEAWHCGRAFQQSSGMEPKSSDSL